MARNKESLFVHTDFGDYDLTMKAIQNTAIPDAVRDTLNTVAHAVTKQQIREVERHFIVRTPFTLKSMERAGARPYKALNKAKGKNIGRMFSRSGSTSKYLWMHDEGHTQKGYTGNVPIATKRARISKSIRKRIASPNRINGNLFLEDGPVGTNTFIGTPRGANSFTPHRRRGMYRRVGKNKQLVMLRNLESESVKIKGRDWHSRSVELNGRREKILITYKRKLKGHMTKNPTLRRNILGHA